MKAIMIVFLQKRDGQEIIHQESLETGANNRPAMTSAAERLTARQATPAFWTWFIENPRGREAAT
jgi:hypothetical protein